MRNKDIKSGSLCRVHRDWAPNLAHNGQYLRLGARVMILYKDASARGTWVNEHTKVWMVLSGLGIHRLNEYHLIEIKFPKTV